jgi:hypothetical protein
MNVYLSFSRRTFPTISLKQYTNEICKDLKIRCYQKLRKRRHFWKAIYNTKEFCELLKSKDFIKVVFGRESSS